MPGHYVTLALKKGAETAYFSTKVSTAFVATIPRWVIAWLDLHPHEKIEVIVIKHYPIVNVNDI